MTEHYFSADPSGSFELKSFREDLWGANLLLTSGSGVFSHGHLDHGTAALFSALDPPRAGISFLDLGCGYGVIALALAAAGKDRAGVEVTAIDVNERALMLTRRNAAANSLAVRVLTPLEVPAADTFDEIWSNPPIRIGKQALHALLLQWLPRLNPGGRAVLVVGKNLGSDSLQRWLGDQGWPARRVASIKGFRVLEVRRG